MKTNRRPVALIILDGWGRCPIEYPEKWDAVCLADTPVMDALTEKYPTTLIRTSGNDVGLPDGVMGNSEVGHMNLGAGRVVWQEIVRIDKAVKQDDFESIEPLRSAMQTAQAKGKRVHLMGLVSDGSVHSVDRHYFALLRLAKKIGLRGNQVAFHAFTDGRDTPPQSGLGYVTQLQNWMTENGTGVIATVIGRYYAMDRDKRWERTKLAYDAMCYGTGTPWRSALEAVEASYAEGVTDEFIKPCVIRTERNSAVTIEDGDQLICFNYRADRVRQISRALVEPDFTEFERKAMVVELVTMTPYIKGLPAKVAFPPLGMKNTLGEVVSAAGKTQVRIAETEKYPHVSFFFSGGVESPYRGEDRILVPSPRDVPTYDKKPEMSAFEVSEKTIKAIKDPGYDLVVLNFANADMVGHTGSLEAATKAVEAVDKALGPILDAIREQGGCAIVTADHGNAEQMWNFDADAPHTQHTTNTVPLVLVDDKQISVPLRNGGRLADIAPTLLELMGLPKPPEMDGESLVVG